MNVYNIVSGSESTVGGAPIYARRSAAHTNSSMVYGNGMGFRSLLSAISLVFRRPRAVVIHDMSGFYYSLLPRPLRAPYIYNSLGLWRRYFDTMKHEGFLQKIKGRIAVKVEKHVIENSDRIITISKQIKTDIIRYYGVPGEKIHVVYPGSNDVFYSSRAAGRMRSKIREKYGIGRSEYVILFIGQDFLRKGLTEAIEAVRGLREFRLIVIGNEKDETFNHFLKKADSMGVSDRVIFEKIVPDIGEYLYASDMLVLPAHYDPFCMAVTEAMSHKLPVAVSTNAGASELITDGVNGLLLDKTDSRTVASKIALVKNRKLMEKISRNGLETAKKMNWKNQGMEYKKIYDSVAGKGTGSRSR